MKSIVLLLALLSMATSFQLARPSVQKFVRSSSSLKMLELEANTATYVGMFLITAIPSLAFVKFVGDSADNSRSDLSADTKRRFKKAMMEQPGRNLSDASEEEESLKRQIAEAYKADKDLDVAVLEGKLKLRQKWRQEVRQAQTGKTGVDEDGW